MRRINVAIDGPAGAGKSTIARLVASKLNFKYVDTGAMYRAITWLALENNLSIETEQEKIARLAEQAELVLDNTKQGTRISVNGRDVTEAIRSIPVTNNVSKVAQNPRVREILVTKQRDIAKNGGVVMDGRDIGSNVLPDAEVKVFLTASLEERVNRRYRELRAKGVDVKLGTLKKEMEERDKLDSTRHCSPLIKADDAVVIDTTDLSLEQVTAQILSLCQTDDSE